VKFWKTFDIEVIKFKEGLHEVDFPIGDAFFQQVEGNVARIFLQKINRFLLAQEFFQY
jgi:hypothetical protein